MVKLPIRTPSASYDSLDQEWEAARDNFIEFEEEESNPDNVPVNNIMSTEDNIVTCPPPKYNILSKQKNYNIVIRISITNFEFSIYMKSTTY